MSHNSKKNPSLLSQKIMSDVTQLNYYQVPGRGEVLRLMLRIGGMDHKDNYISSKAWKSGLKKKTRWQVIPTMDFPSHNRSAGMSRALLRYLGRTVIVEGSPLSPQDPIEALLCDECMDYLGEDIWGTLIRYLLGEKDAEEIAKKFLAPKGKITLMLDELESNMEGTSSLLSSGKLCTFDVYLFAAIGWFGSGFMTTHLTVERLLENRPRLCEICQRVGNLPAVKEFYADPMNKIVMNGAYSKL